MGDRSRSPRNDADTTPAISSAAKSYLEKARDDYRDPRAWTQDWRGGACARRRDLRAALLGDAVPVPQTKAYAHQASLLSREGSRRVAADQAAAAPGRLHYRGRQQAHQGVRHRGADGGQAGGETGRAGVVRARDHASARRRWSNPARPE